MRRFGVEIEFVGDLSVVLDTLRNAGVPVRDSRHTHSGYSLTEWSVKRDGSVHRGGELVSPPLDFDNEEQRAQVTTAVQALQDSGARPDPSAGIHVHVEAKNFDGSVLEARQIANIVRFTYKFEDLIYRIASSGWQTIRDGARSYARPIPEVTARAIMEVKTQDELLAVWNGQTATRRRRAQLGDGFRRHLDRYTGTNLRAFFDKGTIEFRYFNSSVCPERVQAYIALCIAIVDDARYGFSRSVAKHYPLGSMESGAVKPEALYMRFQQIMRSESKDTKVLMTTEDWKNLRKVCWNDSVPQRREALL